MPARLRPSGDTANGPPASAASFYSASLVQGIAGKAIYIGGATLLGVALVTVLYAIIMGPALAFKFLMWLTRKNVLLRCTILGGVAGVLLGALLALVFDGKSAAAMTNFGLIGTTLGLVVGLIWSGWRRGRMRAALARVNANVPGR